ncbi:T9SS type A sorting domain-containing protein [candidate division KSB1 bacterium]|nr:T9SS type A sorting domain-containing protein [candidate division KSB1 bacterium]
MQCLEYKMNRVSNIVLALVVISSGAHAQTFIIKGVVSTSTTPVRYAAVTFVDNSDTARQFVALTDTSGNYQIGIITSVKSKDNLPAGFELEQSHPNPFSSATAISYRLSTPSAVQLTIYNILGSEVKTFMLSMQTAGAHAIWWDGTNNFGERVASGIYFYRLQANGESRIKKMVFVTGEGNLPASLSKTTYSQTSEIAKRTNALLLGGTYTVLIENTDSTFPAIAPLRIENVVVQSDTTLDFTVSVLNAATIYLDSTQQVIRGFGAANILLWRPDMTAGEIDKAFGAGPGQIGLTILRLRIPPDANSFSVNIRTAQAAYARGVKIIASPWSPPASMKTNNNIVSGRLRESSYAAYAAHLKSFADLMASNGVPLYAISVQNEPDVQVTYESCDWNAAEMLKFVKENAPAIGTDIFVPESFNFNHTISDAILNDSTAASHVAFIGGHIYGGGLRSYPLAESKGKEIWMTEHLDTDTSWTNVLATGKEINDCMNVGMSAYIWWYIVRFYGPIREDGNVANVGMLCRSLQGSYVPGISECLPQVCNARYI